MAGQVDEPTSRMVGTDVGVGMSIATEPFAACWHMVLAMLRVRITKAG
jgi:hypothetical protein